MKKYWTTLAALFMVLSIVVSYWDIFQVLPIALNIMIGFIAFAFVVATYVIDAQDRRIKAQQDFIDDNLQAAVEALYTNGKKKGFGRK